MAEPASGIDFANFPAPDEGIRVTLFITVRKVARSRDFYSRVLGGTVVMDENPCIVKLSNSWIIMNPGGPPTPDKPNISVVDYQPSNTTSMVHEFASRQYPNLLRGVEDERGGVRDAADRAGSGNPLLHVRPRRISHRGRPVYWPAAWPARRKAPGRSPGLRRMRFSSDARVGIDRS
jgi:catechol 2,3-dioxygenase-like lactoylglutathione lyase family enzyme